MRNKGRFIIAFQKIQCCHDSKNSAPKVEIQGKKINTEINTERKKVEHVTTAFLEGIPEIHASNCMDIHSGSLSTSRKEKRQTKHSNKCM